MTKLIHVPQIIRGGRTIELPIVAPCVRMEGWVTVELIHARTGLIKQRLHFRNLIVDAGLDRLGSGANRLNDFLEGGYIAVGTGSTAPAANQTSLTTEIGTRSNSNGGIGTTGGSAASFVYWYSRSARVFLEANANGNLTEFGVFNASSAGNMLARQLFKDGTGTPTTVVKTVNEQLRIIYEFRIYPPTVDASGNIAVNAVNYAWTSRANDITNSIGWGGWGGSSTGYLTWFGSASSVYANASNATGLGTTSQSLTGGTQNANSDTSTITTYVPGSFYREITHVWNVGTANFTGGSGGVSGFGFAPFGSSNAQTHKALVTPFFPKDNTKKLTLVWRFPFGRFP